jgi:hypothetical protein
MSRAEQPDSTPLMLRPWVTWLCGIIAGVQAWALVDNVVDSEWILAVCFGLTTVAFIVQTVVLLRFRRRANR